MEKLPLHYHTKQLEEVKSKVSSGSQLSHEDISFLFDTIEQLEGELKEWIALYEKNIKY
jgi:hypothetical protein